MTASVVLPAGDPRLLAGIIDRPDAVLHVTGPGAVACVQGLFTNDIDQGTLPLLRWGAFLTPKGMIVSDLWVLRDDGGCWLIVPSSGLEAVLALLARSFPPRLARVTDRSDEFRTRWARNPAAETAATGRAVRPDGPAPFHLLLLEPRTEAGDPPESLPPDTADQIMLLEGWPVLGREIDDRTLVQEVRFDELGGVRYDKGCYVGQETVARLHFRGHPNRTLRAVTGTGASPEDEIIRNAEGREVGRIAILGIGDGRWVASARIRREVADGDTVTAGGASGTVRGFPVT